MIGLFGGTFDPIHYGHLRSALEVHQALNLSQVYFIPLALAVHRPPPKASARQRLRLVQIAIDGRPEFQIDDRELRRGTPSYTFMTLVELRQALPETTFCWLLGRDAFNGFLTWHQPQAILDLTHLVVMDRPGASASIAPALTQLLAERHCADPQTLHATRHGRVYIQPVTALDISATTIRTEIAAGGNPQFLLPDAVLAHIHREALYH